MSHDRWYDFDIPESAVPESQVSSQSIEDKFMLTELASAVSRGAGYPGNKGITIQARHGVPSLCALMILSTNASPIRFSISTPSTTVEVMKN